MDRYGSPKCTETCHYHLGGGLKLFLGSFPGFTCTSYALMAQGKRTACLLVCCLLLVDLPIK